MFARAETLIFKAAETEPETTQAALRDPQDKASGKRAGNKEMRFNSKIS